MAAATAVSVAKVDPQQQMAARQLGDLQAGLLHDLASMPTFPVFDDATFLVKAMIGSTVDRASWSFQSLRNPETGPVP
jgi:hypothetical protein